MASFRSQVTRARRVVIKIGSRALASDAELIGRVARDVAESRDGNRRFVIVSSGAIALGFERLGYRRRPKEMPELQASAAVGQSILMQRWASAFAEADLVTAQVLLTHADLTDRERLNNAREALGALIERKAIPIINENDTVATDEIRFGDNDQLASMVVPLVGADLLLLLTDVDGVLGENGKVISVMTDGQPLKRVATKGPALGTGGIDSKIDAARKAGRSGAAVVIANGTSPGIVSGLLKGQDLGTLFPPHGSTLQARKHWIAFTLRPRGAILIDLGAAEVLRSGKSSLLPVGVLGVRGSFNAGDSVLLLAADGTEVGRGLTRLDAMEVARAAGKSSEELRLILSQMGERPIVVHKDDLVLND